MTSESVFVWVTLPGQTRPTLCGRLDVDKNGGSFVYGARYLARKDAVALDPCELHLTNTIFQIEPDRHGGLPGAIRDASPDSWGQYILGVGHGGPMSEVSLLKLSPDDRVGALSFSPSAGTPPTWSMPAPTAGAIEALAEASLRQLQERAPGSSAPTPLSRRTQALLGEPRTSLGGARPKVTVLEEGALWLAKTNKIDDRFDFARTEAAMLDLARLCGIEAPNAVVRRFGATDALLVERFDRTVRADGEVERTRFVSALTCLKAAEGDAKPRSYLRLADEVRRTGTATDGPELFRRMVLNALIGNRDDHLRNHGMLAKDATWRLSPAYDLVPQPTHSHEMRLALAVSEDGDPTVTMPRALDQAGRFGLSTDEARATIVRMAEIVAKRWHEVLRRRGLNDVDLTYVRTAFLNPGLRMDELGVPVPLLSDPPGLTVITAATTGNGPAAPVPVEEAKRSLAKARSREGRGE